MSAFSAPDFNKHKFLIVYFLHFSLIKLMGLDFSTARDFDADDHQIIKRGYIQKESRYRKEWRKRYTILTLSKKLHYKSIYTFHDKNFAKKPTEIISNLNDYNLNEKDQYFSLDNSQTNFNFKCQNESEANQWTIAIKNDQNPLKQFSKSSISQSDSDKYNHTISFDSDDLEDEINDKTNENTILFDNYSFNCPFKHGLHRYIVSLQDKTLCYFCFEKSKMASIYYKCNKCIFQMCLCCYYQIATMKINMNFIRVRSILIFNNIAYKNCFKKLDDKLRRQYTNNQFNEFGDIIKKEIENILMNKLDTNPMVNDIITEIKQNIIILDLIHKIEMRLRLKVSKIKFSDAVWNFEEKISNPKRLCGCATNPEWSVQLRSNNAFCKLCKSVFNNEICVIYKCAKCVYYICEQCMKDPRYDYEIRIISIIQLFDLQHEISNTNKNILYAFDKCKQQDLMKINNIIIDLEIAMNNNKYVDGLKQLLKECIVDVFDWNSKQNHNKKSCQ
eukprot:198160_1